MPKGDKLTHDAWDAISIRYRVLRDVSRRNLATKILGDDLAFPLLIAPMAFQRLDERQIEMQGAHECLSAG